MTGTGGDNRKRRLRRMTGGCSATSVGLRHTAVGGWGRERGITRGPDGMPRQGKRKRVVQLRTKTEDGDSGSGYGRTMTRGDASCRASSYYRICRRFWAR